MNCFYGFLILSFKQFLEMKVDDQSLMYRDGSLKIDEELLCFGPIHRFILDTIYVRNTKQSIGTQYSVPEVGESTSCLFNSFHICKKT